jgi:hypothetical protein
MFNGSESSSRFVGSGIGGGGGSTSFTTPDILIHNSGSNP